MTRDFIARREGGETVGLRVHEAHQQLIVRRFPDDAQVRAVAVDGVVLHAGETAGIHQNVALAVGELKDVAPRRAGADGAFGRRDIHALVGDVSR